MFPTILKYTRRSNSLNSILNSQLYIILLIFCLPFFFMKTVFSHDFFFSLPSFSINMYTAWQGNLLFPYPLWEGPASQPQSTLSRCKNLPPLLKNSEPPKLGPKKTVSIIAFRIALTLDVKIVWFCCQVAVWVQKRHKNAIFGCSWSEMFNFDCSLFMLLIYSQTTENIFKFVCPLLT